MTNIVLEEILLALDGMTPRSRLVLRLHPRDTIDDYLGDVDALDVVSQDGDPIDLVSAADLVICINTMLLLEAAALGRMYWL